MIEKKLHLTYDLFSDGVNTWFAAFVIHTTVRPDRQ
jgi:hypothetical protein